MSEPSDTRKLPVVSFHCSKCGACCNSAPQLSLPELFQHQRRFIGCLTVRRIERLRLGARWGSSSAVTESDRADFAAFVPTYFHTTGSDDGSTLIGIMTQAYDEPRLGRCPALAPDNLCTLEHDGKPLGCRTVPLEALLPDSLQPQILAQRASEAAYFGANCISLGKSTSAPLLVSGPEVVDETARRALDDRRRALVLDRRIWGDSVFEILRSELFDHPERVANLPRGGYLSLSLAPALAVISAASHPVRQRVIEYLSAQIELLADVLGNRDSVTALSARTLEGFVRANVALRGKLQQANADRREARQARDVEAWLGLPAADAESSEPTGQARA